jgi:hypothetical protein
MAADIWPKDWTLYRQEPKEYFRRFDTFVKAAEEKMYWSRAQPFLVYGRGAGPGWESRNKWGNPKSKTIAFMRKYVEDVVGRLQRLPRHLDVGTSGNEYSLESTCPTPPIIVHRLP